MAAKRCSAIRKADGSPCRAKALPNSPHCVFHCESADVVRRRKAGRRRGGRKARLRPAVPLAPDVELQSRAEVLALLSRTINRLQRDQVTPRTASVIGSLCAVALNAMLDAPEAPAQVFFHVHQPSGEVPDDANEREYLARKGKSAD